MKLTLYYGDLTTAADNSNKLASELDDYCDSLSQKVQKKMYSVEGGMSSALNTADYYVNQKIRNLRTKATNARNLAQQINNLRETAKRVDSSVKSTIEANQKNLFEKHAELRPSNVQLYLTSFLCDAKNTAKKIPIIGTLIRGMEVIDEASSYARKHLKNEIRYWYKCEGGKELVGIVLSVVGAILAVVVLVCAFVFTGGTILAVIAGVAGIIGAFIGVINAATNIVTSFQAYESATGGHPGQAKIYAGQDKLSDVLRDTNFHDKAKNRSSNAWATGIDITETVCDVIGIINGITGAVKDLKSSNLKKTFQAVFQNRNENRSRFDSGKNIWNGLKSITSKINGKDMILGDLNVKNLSKFSLLSKAEAIKAIGKVSKAASGIVKDLDKINEGNMGLKDFILKRIVIGLDKSMFQQEEWVAKERKGNGLFQKKGELYSTFDKTNFSKIIQGFRDIVDNLGVSKILIDLPNNDALSNVLSPKSGLKSKIQELIKTITRWQAPTIEINSSLQATSVENWDSAQGYSNVVVKGVSTKRPVLYTLPDFSQRSYLLPQVRFSISPAYRYPYFNITDAA